MAFVYKLQEGEGASTGIYGLIAVFVMLAIKNGTVFFSPVPSTALIILAIYTVGGMLVGKATAFEHISGFTGGLLFGGNYCKKSNEGLYDKSPHCKRKVYHNKEHTDSLP